MMDWILDIYEQTDYLVEITAIITLMVSLCFVFILRIPDTFQEWQNWGDKIGAVLGVWLITVVLLVLPAMYLRDKSEERRAVHIEQPLVK